MVCVLYLVQFVFYIKYGLCSILVWFVFYFSTFCVLYLVFPEILSITEDCSRPGVVVVGTDIREFTLTCVVLGIPPPQVTWEGPQVTMVTMMSQMMGRLVQASATLSSSISGLGGNYTCTGSNELGVVSRSVLVEERNGEMATLCEAGGRGWHFPGTPTSSHSVVSR